jgi:peptidyl-prolyl cis-trans isomerase A (cyclophilin A)
MRWILLLPLLAFLLPGCTAQLKEEMNGLEDQVEALHGQLSQVQTERDRLLVKVEDLEQDLANYALAEEAGLDPREELWAKLDTSRGDILCRLAPDKAPATVSSFVGLAEGSKRWTDPRGGTPTDSPLYDGTIFHRVVAGFMIQGGDPLGTGEGGPGFRIEDEFHPDLRHVAGALSMANTGPDTAGSQFFITEVAAPHLDRRHAVFGRCEPLSLIRDIAQVPVQPPVSAGEEASRPVQDVVLERVTIHRGSKPR